VTDFQRSGVQNLDLEKQAKPIKNTRSQENKVASGIRQFALPSLLLPFSPE
jgi:hypothetical protein